VHLRSDIERKRLFDVHEFDRLPGGAYRPETMARTYQRLRDLAATALDAGHSVVIDAVHLRPEERVAVKQVASRSKSHFTGLWLEGTINTLMERIAKRKKDASDATADTGVTAKTGRDLWGMARPWWHPISSLPFKRGQLRLVAIGDEDCE
jgi:predicted kinase